MGRIKMNAHWKTFTVTAPMPIASKLFDIKHSRLSKKSQNHKSFAIYGILYILTNKHLLSLMHRFSQ